MALVVTSVLLGHWAQNEAGTTALREWLRVHPPSTLAWKALLLEKGYTTPLLPREQARVLRWMPMTTDSQASVWVATEQGLVLVFPGDPAQSEPLVFGRPGQPLASTPPQWQPVGMGWGAYEELMRILKPLPQMASKPAKIRRGEAPDPKALHY